MYEFVIRNKISEFNKYYKNTYFIFIYLQYNTSDAECKDNEDYHDKNWMENPGPEWSIVGS